MFREIGVLGTYHPAVRHKVVAEFEPGFVDAAAGDFRLRANSPCRGAGAFGTDMGASLPDAGNVSTSP